MKTHNDVILITIYSKNEQSGVSSEQVRMILKKYDNEHDTKKLGKPAKA